MATRFYRTTTRSDAAALAAAVSVELGLPKVSRRADGRPSPHAAGAQAWLDGDRSGKPPPGLTLEERARPARSVTDGDPDEWEVPVLERHKRRLLGLRFSGKTLRETDLKAARLEAEPVVTEPTREIATKEPTR